MRVSKLLSSGLALLLLAACATGPKYSEIKSSLTTLDPGNGRIYFYRNYIFFGDGLRPEILLNGMKVGRSVPGAFFYLDRPPSNYEVSTSTEVTRKLTFTLSAGETKYVKTSATMGVLVGHVYPQLISPPEAEVAMSDLHFTEHPAEQ